MLYLIKDFSDQFLRYLQEDPVRPHIPVTDRIGEGKQIFLLPELESVQAITCVSYNNYVPSTEQELFNINQQHSVAIFYTIWSYKPGAGRQLILDSVNYLKENKPGIKRFVTLSPKTEMAKKFHLKNGAIILRENSDTINYEYLI